QCTRKGPTGLCSLVKIMFLVHVLMFRYTFSSAWEAVPKCSPTQMTQCDISEFVNTTDHIYLVRVQGCTEENCLDSVKVRKLHPPTFSLSGNSSSLKITVKPKPFLKNIFTSGLMYHFYLKERGNDKTLDWSSDEWASSVEFYFLQWGQEYCVSSRVEDQARIFISKLSLEQCYVLPKPVNVSFLQKSPRCDWHPLIMGTVPVEIVTDKGFLLLSRKAEEKNQRMQKMVGIEKDEGRRGSMDSGVSMDQQSSETDGERIGEVERRQKEDSGCGSLVEADSSAGRGELTGMSTLDERNQSWSGARQSKRTVMAEPSQYGDASSLENCLGAEVGLTVNYACRGQSPSSKEAWDKTPGNTDCSVAVAVGYRPSQLACVCSGQGLCFWCRVGSHHGTGNKDNTGSESDCLTKDDLTFKCNTIDPSSHYRTSSPLYFQDKNLNTNCSQTTGFHERDDVSFLPLTLPTDSTEHAPLLQCVPQLTLLENGVDNSINTFTGFSLHDMELTFG
ncbi:hypothetical protein GN956_G7886, partial [Arapaima gigas]